jgi:hypothetical protein
MRNKMLNAIFVIVTLLSYVLPGSAQSGDSAVQLAQAVLKKQNAHPYWFRLRSITFGKLPYVFDVKSCIVKYDGKGNELRSRSSATCPHATGTFTPIDDVMFYTPITVTNKPVDAKERKEWERKREEQIAAARRRSESEKAKIKAKEENDRKERALFWDEFVKAFNFEISGQTNVDGRPTTVLSFTPSPKYRPGDVIDTKYLPKLHGQIWVDDYDIEIARFEVEFKEDVTAGLGLFGRVYAGTTYFMELKKGIDDKWLPRKAETLLRMRQGLVVKTDQRYTYEYDNYRKFTTDVKILEENSQ